MDLHIKIYDFVKSNGLDALRRPQASALMADLQVFHGLENKRYLPLFRFLCKKGYIEEFVKLGSWNESAVRDMEEQINEEFSGPADVHYALECIAFALGWKSDAKNTAATYQPSEIDQQVDLSASAVEYIAHGSQKCIGTLIPASMAQPVHNQLNVIAHEEGSIADFLMDELNIKSQEELEAKVSGEQMDGIAMAIRQMRQGKGFILGDMTGIGKGRQMAMLLNWAVLQGDQPVYVTEKSVLFSDVYRDLMDVGCGHLTPFILNADPEARITDPTGMLVHDMPAEDDMETFKTSGKIPAGYDFLLLTYSQLSRERDKNWKWDAVMNACRNSFIFLDESHNASGESSNVGKFFREAVRVSCGVCFASATYAKYPSSMPIYAMKTAMSDANISSDQLIDIISHGGPILQEVMANGLVSSGSMIRRQRDMSDVERILYYNENAKCVASNRQRYDKIIELIQDIRDWQNRFIKPYLMCQDAETILRKRFKIRKTEKFERKRTHIGYCSFSLRMTPAIRQLLFAIKTDDAIAETLRELKAGRKPIVQLNRTMESNYANLFKNGELSASADFALALLNNIESMFHYNVEGVLKTQNGRSGKHYTCSVDFELKDLTTFFGNDEVKQGYDFLVSKIRSTRTGLPISPVDYFKQKIQDAGYSVGELTQRSLGLKYADIQGIDKGVTGVRISMSDKKKMAVAFNNGLIDVLIGNRTMASGISLHSSSLFCDQRQRVVITWEQQDSADRQIQFDGRADRTGQLCHCAFEILSSCIPAEKRFLMMQERKLRSLNANVEANQYTTDSLTEDLLNPYGAKVAAEYLKENPQMAYILDDTESVIIDKSDEKTQFVSKFIRNLGLLPCAEQENILNELVARYNELINYLDQVGENELRTNVLPLEAKLLKRSVFAGGRRNSTSSFGQDAMLDEVEVNVIKKPLTSAQVQSLKEQLSDASNLVPWVGKICKQRISSIADYYDSLRKDAMAQLKAVTAPGAPHYMPSRISQLNERANNDRMKKLQMQKVQESYCELISALQMFTPGQAVGIPKALVADCMIDDAKLAGYVSVGLFLGFRVTGNKPTKSGIKAVFAVNDSRVRLDIPLSEGAKLQTIQKQSKYAFIKDMLKNVTIKDWDTIATHTSTERAYIVTGNLLLGIAVARSFGKKERSAKLQQLARNKGRGHLVVYTDDYGRVRNGFMMPRIFSPTDVSRFVPKKA